MFFLKSKGKFYSVLLSFLFILPVYLCSCNSDDEITKLFDTWIAVENLTPEEKNSDQLFETDAYQNFLSCYNNFTATDLYKNIGLSETYSEVLEVINQAILKKDFYQLRNAIFSLESIDKKATFKSNQEYFLLD